MNKKQDINRYCSLEEFDRDLSLWQMVPSEGNGLKRLKLIVDAVHNGKLEQSSKPLSVLITGDHSKRTHGRAFLRALGASDISELPAYLLSIRYSLTNFVASQSSFDGLLLANLEHTAGFFQHTLYQYLSVGRYMVKNLFRTDEDQNPFDIYYGDCPIVLTSSDIKKVPQFVRESIDHIITIGLYTPEQLKLVILQRIKYCGIGYEGEDVLEKIVKYGMEKLDRSVFILKESITVMSAESETTLQISHVETAIRMLQQQYWHPK